MTGEAKAIMEAMPSNNEMRISTITSISPLQISVQGGEVTAGKLASYAPIIGDTVAVLRQDATWLILGSTNTALRTGFAYPLFAQASALLGLTAAVQDVAGTTVTFTTGSPAALYISWTGDFESLGTTATLGVLAVSVDGTTLSSPIATFNNAGITGNRASPGNQIWTSVDVGSHTIVLRGSRATGADGMLRLNALHTTLSVAVYL